MKSQRGLTVLAALMGVVVVCIGIVVLGNAYKSHKKEEAAAQEAAERLRIEKEEKARAAQAEREADIAEKAAQEKAAKFCHEAVIKRAKYESKARIVKTMVEKTTERMTIDNVNDEHDIYIVSGIIDMMNGYGALLPNVYKCRVNLDGNEFLRTPAVAGEDEGSDAEKAELRAALRTLGMDPSIIR